MERIEKLELYDIYELWHVPFWQRPWFRGMVVCIIIAIVCYGCYWFYRRFLKKKPAPLSPWAQALAELSKLQMQPYETKEQGKQFYFQITDILKRYIGARFNLDTYGKTDEELVSFLQGQKLTVAIKDGIADITQGCVFIKFAGQEAMQEQIKRHLDLGVHLVTQTIPEQ